MGRWKWGGMQDWLFSGANKDVVLHEDQVYVHDKLACKDNVMKCREVNAVRQGESKET